ncbi:MAG: AAA family ATPase [Candidatus Desulfofervidaceae bacterium]|nr:AAA family ATPase [Candidatus Desulfofervidaceae bacterium]
MDFINFLLKPLAYPHPVEEIKLLQTHISWVFLTGDFVYKIKKPVDFGFLDFTTLEKRHYFCQEEIRLNRRLSPDIYLDVVPVVKREGGVFIGGEGEVIDYAVKMKQLPEESCLTSLLEKGELTSSIMEKIARIMANFYASSETNEEIATYGLPEKIEVNIKENFDQTKTYTGRTISREIYEKLKKYSFEFLRDKKVYFLNRIKAGQIKDGHGDFHCANIYYYQNKVYVLDCIEFNTRFRYADVAADVAFLLMDLDFRQASPLGNYFLNTYLAQTNDFGLLGVLNFYKIYRAYVRGKISSFEADMSGISQDRQKAALARAKAYFELAYSYLQPLFKPCLLATVGFLGSGKSTVARHLAARLGAVVIRSDAVRKHILGLKPDEHLYVPFGQGIYAPEVTKQVYANILNLAKEALNAGFPVILDASFNKEVYRQGVRDLAQALNCPYYFLHLQCDEDILKQRLAKRQEESQDISDGHLGLLSSFKQTFEPLKDENQIVLDTTQPVEKVVQEAADFLSALRD